MCEKCFPLFYLRLSTGEGDGAWCPAGAVFPSGSEYLQVRCLVYIISVPIQKWLYALSVSPSICLYIREWLMLCCLFHIDWLAQTSLPGSGWYPGPSCWWARPGVCSQLSAPLLSRWSEMDHLEGPMGPGCKQGFINFFTTSRRLLNLMKWQFECY